jgi:two-component system OmpR family response regulator
MAALLKRGLSEDGYLVEVTTTGPDALRQACELEYDVILLDVMLPRMSGIEVCRRLRERKRWIPVLMLTALGTIEDRVMGLNAGADDYMVKPFRFDELSARVGALIRRGAVERPTEAEVTGLRPDSASAVGQGPITPSGERSVYLSCPAVPQPRRSPSCEQNISSPK